jgi:DNA-binding NarL/FixJ family response regulator
MHPSLDFDRDVLPVVTPLAKCNFKNSPHGSELIADAISVAWEILQQSPAAATPQSISMFAIMRVKIGRQFREKLQSITGPNPRRRQRPKRSEMVQATLTCEYEDPADIAQMRVDVEDWLVVLTARQIAFLEAFVSGERTQDIAKRFRVSPARVSQLRGELVAHWQAFTG